MGMRPIKGHEDAGGALSDHEFLRTQNSEVRIWNGAQRLPSSEFWLLDSQFLLSGGPSLRERYHEFR